jgi:RNA polymerase sigma factor (sigma-70 family)
MDEDDRELLERIQREDGEGFGVLFDRTHRWLLQCVIVPRVGQSEAEDVLSETFRAALGSIGSFEWRGIGLLHWLAAIARRKCQEHRRALARAPEPLGDLLDDVEIADEAPTADAEMLRREVLEHTRDRVERTLGALHERYDLALRLRLLEERPRAACAEVLGVSVETFDVLLHRATKAFAKEWRRP